jgi:hypothetical protein
MGSGNKHSWEVFGKFRIGTFVLVSLLDLALAVIVLVALLSNWAAHESLQKALSTIVFLIQLLSALALCLLCLGRIRPLFDLGCVSTLLVFEIGSMVAYTLAAPLLPCFEDSKGILIFCKFHHSFVFYGSSASCILLALFLLFLFPMLRVPQPKASSFLGPPISSKDTFSDSDSTFTYVSWDKDPEKKAVSDTASSWSFSNWDSKPKENPAPKHTSITSNYSQASYNYALPRRKSSLAANKPSAPPLRPVMERSPIQSSPTSPQSTMSVLRPYSPPPPPVDVRDPANTESAYAASWLMEPPRALLSSPKQSLKAVPQPTLRSSVAVSPTTIENWRQNKHRPGMLSLDTTTDTLTLSDDVPRSPSPMDPSTPPFPPTPLSGALPKHPRLTMHMREMSLASSRNTSPTNSPRLLV